ncbi:MAG: peptide chain release factor N(5)-glutamine methyltransferase [Bermanella sp.]
MSLAITQALAMGREKLIDSDTPALDCELILLFCLNASRNILFTDPNKELSPAQQLQYSELLARRQQGEPVAYLIGTQGFWDLHLKVSPHTLIPRGDTESLIDWVLEQNLNPKTILDLGTGTGALALSMAHEFPNASVIGVDVVADAVLLAQENQTLNKIENAKFLQSSWFDALNNESFDLIISNPPYIDEDDPHLSQGDVRFEPSSALTAKQQGFADLFFIAGHAQQYLNPQGCLVMEHGWQQAESVRSELLKLGYKNVGSGEDLGKRERFTFGFSP